MPFLVDSVTMEVNRHGLDAAPDHPSARRRDARRRRHAAAVWRRERDAPDARARIVHPRRGRPRGRRRRGSRRWPPTSTRVLGDVRAGRRRLEGDAASACCAIVARARRAARRRCPPQELAEGRAFLRWLADNHFTFLGYRSHDLVDGRRRGRAEDRARLEPRHPARDATPKTPPRASPRCRRRCAPTRAGPSCWSSPSRPRARPCTGPATSTTSASSASTPQGKVCGEHRFLGLFTSTAYSASPAEIPLLRAQGRRRRRARRPAAGQPLGQGAAQHPRDLSARRAVPDQRRRAAATPRWASCTWASASASACSCGAIRSSASSSCLIYAPRENYTTELRQKWQAHPDAGVQRHQLRVQRAACRSRCWRASTSRCAPRPAASRPSTCASSKQRLVAAARRWDDDLQDGADRSRRRGARQRAAAPASAAPSRPATATSSRRAPRCPTSS